MTKKNASIQVEHVTETDNTFRVLVFETPFPIKQKRELKEIFEFDMNEISPKRAAVELARFINFDVYNHIFFPPALNFGKARTSLGCMKKLMQQIEMLSS